MKYLSGGIIFFKVPYLPINLRWMQRKVCGELFKIMKSSGQILN
jgi:hypothetical protein